MMKIDCAIYENTRVYYNERYSVILEQAESLAGLYEFIPGTYNIVSAVLR